MCNLNGSNNRSGSSLSTACRFYITLVIFLFLFTKHRLMQVGLFEHLLILA